MFNLFFFFPPFEAFRLLLPGTDFSCIKRLRNEGDKARKQTEELMKYPNL